MSDKLLYNIVQLHEWPEEETKVEEEKPLQRNMLRIAYETSLASFKKSFHLLRLAGLPYKQANSHAILNALNLMRSQKQWIFSVNSLCNYVAILQIHLLEVRHLDEELTLSGKFVLPNDSYKSKGVIAWEQGGSLFAAALGNGTVGVFDATCSKLCIIEPGSSETVGEDAYNLCGLMLMPARNKKDSWSLELFVLLNNGVLLNYFLSSQGDFQLFHSFNFGGYYSQGITCALMDVSSRLIVIGGNLHSGYIEEDEITGDKLGITKWRILSDYPFYKKDLGESSVSKCHSKKSFLRKSYFYASNALQRFYATPMDGVYMMSLSPDQSKLVAVHFNGSISLWDFPSMRIRNIWMLKDQPCHDDVNPSLSSRFGRKRRIDEYAPIRSYPFDISWWNNEAVSISRCSGSLTILSISDRELANLFGTHCEWVPPFCQLSPAFDGRFYLLECHKTPVNKKMKMDDDAENEDDDDSLSFVQKGVQFVQAMTGLKEIKSKERNDNRKYTLLTLTKTTPQELYERKIDDKEFGEALSIAQAYDLDCDKVFQRQWRNAPISRASIEDYLSKVKNQLWVYRECMDRVPEHIDDMKELIEFALSITDIDKMALLCNPNLEETFQVEELEDYHGFDYDLQQARKIEKRLHFEQQWKRHVNFSKLTLEQNEMMKCRQKILKYKDRLATYVILNGGYDAATERYTSDDFAVFRKRDLLQLALEYAHSSKWEAVDTMMQHHYDQLQEHWLPLLSNFPETLPPYSYSCLLPEVVQGQVGRFMKSTHRDVVDWCESDCALERVTDADEFYERNPELLKFKTTELTPDLVNAWYEERARKMEKLSHMTEEALHLIDLGNEKGATGLSQLQFDLKTLDDLLFECGSDLSLNLDGLLKKSPLERIRLMMAQSISTNYIRDIQRFVIPFVKKSGEENLFQTYLLEIAEKDLTLALVVFKHMLTNKNVDFDFKDRNHVIDTALDCIYAKDATDQLDLANRILNCLPKTDSISGEQRDKISLMENTLECCRLLAKHKNPHTPQQLRLIAEDSNQVLLLFKRVTRSLTRVDAVNSSQCKILLEDLKSIASKLFSTQMHQTKCVDILIESLLASALEGNIRLAGDMMVRSESESRNARLANRLPYSESVSLVLSASIEYFDAASHPLTNNKLLRISKLCLLLITDHPPAIQEQLDLIEAVLLIGEFGVEMLPLEVRLCRCEDRLEIIAKAISSRASNYLRIHDILHLASLLRVSDGLSGQPKGVTLNLIADKALKEHDFRTAINIARDLMDMNYPFCWKLCHKLAERKEIEDLKFRHSCISFACCYCDVDRLTSLTDTLCGITASLLEQDLEEQVPSEEEMEEVVKVVDRENGEVTAFGLIRVLQSVSSPERDRSHTLKTSAQLLAGTVNVTTGVIKSGWSLLKKDAGFHSSELPSSQCIKPSAGGENEDFETPSFPIFYRSLLPPDRNDLNYSSIENVVLDTSSIDTLRRQAMLRISVLASMRDRMVENLKSLASLTLPHDLPLGISYLLALPEPNAADECFQSLPLTSLSLQAQVYYQALQVLSRFFDVTSNCLPLYRAPPSAFIDRAIEDCDVTGSIGSPDNLQQAIGALITFIQGEKLSSLGQEIDMGRCLTDPSYTRDTVHGLAMTTNEEQFLVAILLAERRSCDVWQVALTHVEYLFTETDGSVEEEKLFDELRRLKILSLLVSRGKELYQRFDTRVFPLIDGRDHSTLICYFNVLKECDPSEIASCVSANEICNLSPQMHVDYLIVIKDLASGLDYKLLISRHSSTHILSSLKEHLNENNVEQLSKLISGVPYQNERIVESSVYLRWIDKYFWLARETANSEEDWMLQLSRCSSKWLPKLDASDLRIFFEDLLYSKESVRLFTYQLRGQCLNFALKFAKAQADKFKKTSKAARFLDVKNDLEKLKLHFSVFASPFMKEVIAMSEHDEKREKFLRNFDSTRSEPGKVMMIAVESAFESVEFTKKFLHSLPHLKITFEKVLTQCSNELLQKLSEANTDVATKAALSSLEKLLLSIESYNGKEKKRLFNQVVTSLQDFCNNETVNVNLKIEVLQLLRKSAALSKGQCEFLLYHRAKELVATGWGFDAAEKILQDVGSISDQRFQRQIVTSLLDVGSDLEQVKCAASLVDLLSQDSVNSATEDDMWSSVLSAYAQHAHAGGEEIVKEAHKRKFSGKVSKVLFELLTSHSLVLAAVKFALVTKLPSCTEAIQKLLGSVTEINSSNCDDELLSLLIDSNFIIHTLSTLYYHRVVHCLMNGTYEDADVLVDRLVRQLQDSGHISEASTLLLRYRGSHTVFATFGSSMSQISNWLKNNA